MGGESGNATETPSEFQPEVISAGVRTELASATNWRQQAQQVQTQAHVFYLAFKHPRTPWYAKVVAACTAGYLFSPIQLIPSFIPVIGFLDDFLVLFLGVKLIQRIVPPDVLLECRQHADDAEVRRKDKIRSSAAMVAAVVIATVWLLTAVAANGLIAAYIRR
jgi:uncharacterized membrane protein YkvA (DUF1232 family)